MDTSRVSQAELIAGAGGLLLFVFEFLDWFSIANAWEFFDITDVLFAIIGLGTAAVVGARAAGMAVAVPPVAIFLGGFFALSITLVFVLEGEERKIGLWLAMFASAAIAYGGWQAMTARTRPARTTPPPAATPPPAV
jgi:TRAP-type uncharacterized transport system fused permease subunit